MAGLLTICTLPSFILGIREAIYADSYAHGHEKICSSIPLWIHHIETIDHLFMTAFSAFGGIIYCLSSIKFRKKIHLLMRSSPPPAPNNSVAEMSDFDHENLISGTNEGISLEILSNSQLRIQAENMASIHVSHV